MKKKEELRKLIDDENGPKFSRNIDLEGSWVFYRRDSFISFKIVNVNDVNTIVIQYIYIVNKNDLLKLLSQCISFWTSQDAKFIYFLEHAREANYCKKYLSLLDFNIIEENRPNVWKYDYKSTNGFGRDDIREYFV